MRKYIPFAGAVLFSVTVLAQQDHTVIAAWVDTKSHTVIQLTAHQKVSFSLPTKGLLQEMHLGKPMYRSSSKRSKLNGNWQSWYTAGHLCDSGRLINNLPDGEWKYWNEKGQLMALRTYNADKYNRVNGELLRYHPRSSFYTISNLAQKDKQAALYYLGAAYSFPQSSRRNAGSLRELVELNISDPALYRPVFDNCLHEGLYLNYFENGQVRDSGYYRDGLREGIWLHRDAVNGSWWEGTYHNGVRTREWKGYSSSGRLKELVIYQKGEIAWRKNYNNQ